MWIPEDATAYERAVTILKPVAYQRKYNKRVTLLQNDSTTGVFM